MMPYLYYSHTALFNMCSPISCSPCRCEDGACERVFGLGALRVEGLAVPKGACPHLLLGVYLVGLLRLLIAA